MPVAHARRSFLSALLMFIGLSSDPLLKRFLEPEFCLGYMGACLTVFSFGVGSTTNVTRNPSNSGFLFGVPIQIEMTQKGFRSGKRTRVLLIVRAETSNTTSKQTRPLGCGSKKSVPQMGCPFGNEKTRTTTLQVHLLVNNFLTHKLFLRPPPSPGRSDLLPGPLALADVHAAGRALGGQAAGPAAGGGALREEVLTDDVEESFPAERGRVGELKNTRAQKGN